MKKVLFLTVAVFFWMSANAARGDSFPQLQPDNGLQVIKHGCVAEKNAAAYDPDGQQCDGRKIVEIRDNNTGQTNYYVEAELQQLQTVPATDSSSLSTLEVIPPDPVENVPRIYSPAMPEEAAAPSLVEVTQSAPMIYPQTQPVFIEPVTSYPQTIYPDTFYPDTYPYIYPEIVRPEIYISGRRFRPVFNIRRHPMEYRQPIQHEVRNNHYNGQAHPEPYNSHQTGHSHSHQNGPYQNSGKQTHGHHN